MWKKALVCLFIVVPLEAMIIFENPVAANTSADGFIYTDPVRERIDKVLQRALADFSLRLETQFSANPGSNPNVVFSPLSITSVLAIVLLGARGVTHTELAKLLGFTAGVSLTGGTSSIHEELGRLIDTLKEHPVNQNEALVTIPRGLFLQKDLSVNQTFINQTIDFYHTEIQRVNFQTYPREAQGIINKWVENSTEGHIKNLLEQEPDTQTQAVIASALYFIGQWENPFYPHSTKQPFFVGKQAVSSDDEIVHVDLMVNVAKIPYYADPERKCSIMGMPYIGNKITMYVILPDEDVKSFLDNTNADDLDQLVRKTERTTVIFLFPRMRLESTIDLVPPLINMGIKSLFDSRTANLSNIADGVFLNEAVHKVVIDINESGTVAAAATALAFFRGGRIEFRVDKPFVFFIRHEETGVILFWGTVIKPTPHYPVPYK